MGDDRSRDRQSCRRYFQTGKTLIICKLQLASSILALSYISPIFRDESCSKLPGIPEEGVKIGFQHSVMPDQLGFSAGKGAGPVDPSGHAGKRRTDSFDCAVGGEEFVENVRNKG